MTVAFSRSSESHSGTTGSTSEASFSWAHPGSRGQDTGIVVFTFTNANADDATAVTMGGVSLTAVSSGRAVDTAGEPGDCKAWFLSGSIEQNNPTGFWGSTTPGLGTSAVNRMASSVAVADGGQIIYINEAANSTWTAASSPGFGTSNVLGVAANGGTYVAVGGGGKVRYSTDRSTWTAASSPGFGTSNVNAVTANVFGTAWVAVADGGQVRYATDPTGTWTAASSPGFGTTNVLSVANRSTTWVAVGAAGSLRYTTSPTGTWTAASSAGFGTSNINDVAAGPSYWVAVGDGGQVRYTTSPSGTWTAASSPGFGTSNVLGVAYGSGYWVAVADGGQVRYATDPTGTWSPASSPGFGTTNVRCVHYWEEDVSWLAGSASGSIRWAATTLTVTRSNTANEMYAVAVTVGSTYPQLKAVGVSTASGDAALSEVSVNDGSNGTASLRFAGVNSGLAGIVDNPASPGSNNLSRGTNSTWVRDIDFGTRVIGVVRETNAGEGSRSVGFSSTTSDDVAAVYLAIQEQVVPWTVGIPIR